MSRKLRWRLALLLVTGALAAPLRAARVDVQLQQRDGRAVADAVVYAIPLDARHLPPPRSGVLDQRDRRFVPSILPVQTGAAVTFPNTDSISHHVYSFSPPKRFQLYLAKGETHPPVTFDRPGVVALGCNIHDWMLAYILVVDTAWFTQTDAAGRATLDELPAGRWRLEVWHPRITDAAASLRREVRVDAAAAETWQLELKRPLLPARDQEPGFADYE